MDDWLKKADEIESKIDALEELQDKIDDFLNFNIEVIIDQLFLRKFIFYVTKCKIFLIIK